MNVFSILRKLSFLITIWCGSGGVRGVNDDECLWFICQIASISFPDSISLSHFPLTLCVWLFFFPYCYCCCCSHSRRLRPCCNSCVCVCVCMNINFAREFKCVCMCVCDCVFKSFNCVIKSRTMLQMYCNGIYYVCSNVR